MQGERILNDLKQKIEEYAANRLKDVKRGAETAHLAGLIVQKYGYGMADAGTYIKTMILKSICKLYTIQ